MTARNTVWTAKEDAVLTQAAKDRISTARLSVRLQRSEGSVKRRMRELGLAGKERVAPAPLDHAEQATRWLDVCRAGDLIALMTFYDPEATLACGCAGDAVYSGAGAIQQYWALKLRPKGSQPFSLGAVRAENGRVMLDYLSNESKPVRMYMSFDQVGKIVHSECAPRCCDAVSA